MALPHHSNPVSFKQETLPVLFHKYTSPIFVEPLNLRSHRELEFTFLDT